MLYLLFRFLKFAIPLFPLRFLYSIAELKGRLFYYLMPVRKKTALKNLRFAFPEKPDDEIKRILNACYVNVIKIIIEFFYIPKLAEQKKRINEIIRIKNPELAEDMLKRGKGIVLISGHYGNWELMAFGCPYIFNKKFNVIVKEQSDKKMDKAINDIRRINGNNMVYMEHALKNILTLLRNNEIVVFLSDQSAPADGSLPVHFFADNVQTFEGSARFALKTGASVLFSVPHRDSDNSFVVVLEEIDTTVHNTPEKLTQAHAALLENHIRMQPEMWLWFHRKFKGLIQY